MASKKGCRALRVWDVYEIQSVYYGKVSYYDLYSCRMEMEAFRTILVCTAR